MVHQYKLNGYNIVLDTCSGSVHVVDEVAYDIIALYPEKTPEEIVSAILAQYGGRPDVNEEEVRACISDVAELERAGATFQNKQRQDVRIRYVAPVAAALVMVALMSGVAAVMLWAFWAAPTGAPLAVVLALEAVPLLIICGVLYALFQRIREIGRGESDDAKQY